MEFLFEVLNLLSYALKLALHLDYGIGHMNIRHLAPDSIYFTADLLNEKVEPSADSIIR